MAKRKEKPKLIRFDPSEGLENPEAAAEYLSLVLAGGDEDELLRALGHIAKARGMSAVAAAAGLGRESLYKALAPGSHPRHDTITKVMRALGLELRIVSVDPVMTRGSGNVFEDLGFPPDKAAAMLARETLLIEKELRNRGRTKPRKRAA
jgi:probable addiction module antidote protein